MATKTLDTLIFEIAADTSSLRRALAEGDANVNRFAQRTESQLDGVSKKFGAIGSNLRKAFAAFGLGVSVAGIVRFTRGAIESADAVGEAAAQAGFGAEKFQRLQAVFEKNGVKAGEFEAGLRALNTRLGAFITTGEGPAVKAIKDLGLAQDIANGKIRTAEQLFDALVAKLGTVESSAERAAIAAQFFGREAGAKLAATLGIGTAAMNEAAASIKGVFSDDQVMRASEVNDKLADLSRTMTTFKGTVVDAVFWWRQLLFPTAGEDAAERIDFLNSELKRLLPTIDRLSQGTPGPLRAAEIERLKGIVAEYAAELESLIPLQKRVTDSSGEPSTALSPEEIAAIEKRNQQMAMLERGVEVPVSVRMKKLPTFDPSATRSSVTAADRESVRKDLAELEEQALRAQGKLAEAIRMAADEQIRQWERVAKETPEFADEAASAIVAINERAAADTAALNEKASKKANELAQSLGHGLTDAMSDAFLGIETDFGDLLKRMAARLASSALLKAIGSAFKFGSGPAGSFFSNLFGGAFASGGRPPMGRVSVVGESGPELFVPDMPGRILSNAQSRAIAGGVSVSQVNNIDARGADQSAVAMLPSVLAQNNARLKAEIADLMRRGRFA